MSVDELINAVTAIVRVFENPLYIAFSAMIAFSVGIGIKRMILE